MEMFWTKENLQKITKIFKEKGVENWPKICMELQINKGNPARRIKKAYYSKKPTADYYEYEDHSKYDKIKNVIVVENPFSTIQQVVNNNNFSISDFPIFGQFIEIDAEVARKILVLGLP